MSSRWRLYSNYKLVSAYLVKLQRTAVQVGVSIKAEVLTPIWIRA